tara:strand:+ start:538 stop:2106 length:1569 start_codon:yes stop_codon:yes gene_type:complete
MELCDQYLHDLIKIDPTMNDFFLFDEYSNKKHIQPDFYSEKHYQKLHTLDLKYKKILEKKENKTLGDRILLRDILHNIHMELEYEIYMYMPINLNDNVLIDYVTECSGNGTYQFEKRRDYLDFMKRLQSLNVITNEILMKMKNGMDKKVCLPRRTVDKMIETINNILKNNLYDNNSKPKPKEWDETVQKYLVKNLLKLNMFLIQEYYPYTKDDKIGLCAYKGGKSAYQKMIQYKTFQSITPQQVYDLGWKELKRLNKEKKRLETKMGLKNIDESVQKYTFKHSKDILQKLKNIRKDLQTNVFSKNFHGSLSKKDLYLIKPVPLENKRMFAYYVSSDLKNKKKGTFYINTFKPENINKHELYVLSLHEGIPGHHYEVSFHNNAEIPNYLKLGDDGYSEGWGLYSENLGNYKDDYEYYFKLEYERLRSLRLILDTAIHFFGWKYDQCFQLMKKELVNYTDKQIDKAIIRYMNNPGQAITYKIGEKAFLYVRDKLLKEGHTIKDIHQIMLEVGPCPIELFVEIVK